MTYKEFIQNIINTRGQWNIPDGEYYENHHIIPKCLGGLPKIINHYSKHDNLIWLTAQEHFIAHRLLAIEHPENKSLCYAWHTMCHLPDSTHKRTITISAQEYEQSRILYIKHLKKHMKGTNNPMYGKHRAEETKQKLRVANLGKEMYWWNNGIKNTMSKDCPGEGWIRGRLGGFKHKNNSNYKNQTTRGYAKKYLYQLPDGTFKVTTRLNAKRWHSDWVEIKDYKGD